MQTLVANEPRRTTGGGARAVEVRPFSPADAGAWSAYVEGSGSATVFHRLAWSEAVERAYGHRPVHLAAWRAGRLAGILPLFLVRSAFAGRIAVSLPYATYGGIVADDAEAASALLAAARRLKGELHARYVELRHRDHSGLDLPTIDRYDTFRRRLPAEAADVPAWLPRKTRAAARKGQAGHTVETGGHLLDVVYDLYAFTLRRLGSPNYRRGLFHALRDAYGDDCVCMVVRQEGKPVAGVVSFVFRDEIVPYFSGSLPEGMKANANNVMYLKLMEHAVRRGLRWFDFNRTRCDNPGPRAFKQNHGFEPSPLAYQVVLDGGEALPNLSPGNPKFALAVRTWRLLPLWLTRRVGGWITKWIP